MAVLMLGSPAQAQAEEFPLEEYENHVKDYVSSLENLSVEFTTTDETVDGTARFRDEHVLVSMPGHFRVKSSSWIEEKGKISGPGISWALLRPDGYYLIREKAEGQFLLKRRQSKVTSPLLVDEGDSPLLILLQPVCDQYPLIRMLRGEMSKTHVLKVTGFKSHPVHNGTGYTLRSSYWVNGEKGEVSYALNDRWLFDQITVISKTSGVRLVRNVSYTRLGDRTLPARITVKRTDPSGKATSFEANFRNYQVYNGSPADFSLTQFGLPEAVDYHPPAAPSRVWLYLLGAAVLCLGIAALFRRRYRQPVARTAK